MTDSIKHILGSVSIPGIKHLCRRREREEKEGEREEEREGGRGECVCGVWGGCVEQMGWRRETLISLSQACTS